MNCKETAQHLSEALDPDGHVCSEAEQHLEACEACRCLREDLILIRELAREETPRLPDSFELDLRRRLHQSEVRAAELETQDLPARGAGSRRGARRWIALAAALVLALGGALLAQRWTHAPEETPRITYHQLHLEVSARGSGEALFDIELPSGVRLAEQAGAALGAGRRLSWKSRLEPGINTFDLPLADRSPGARLLSVRARLTVGQRVYRSEVTLTSGQAHAQPSGPRLAWVVGRMDDPARDREVAK